MIPSMSRYWLTLKGEKFLLGPQSLHSEAIIRNVLEALRPEKFALYTYEGTRTVPGKSNKFNSLKSLLKLLQNSFGRQLKTSSWSWRRYIDLVKVKINPDWTSKLSWTSVRRLMKWLSELGCLVPRTMLHSRGRKPVLARTNETWSWTWHNCSFLTT